jgi:preprotein translocase subunit YajC
VPAGEDAPAVEAADEPEVSLDKAPTLEKDDSANGTPRS